MQKVVHCEKNKTDGSYINIYNIVDDYKNTKVNKNKRTNFLLTRFNLTRDN